MDFWCTGEVHRGSTLPVHRDATTVYRARKTVIGRHVTPRSHCGDTANVAAWDIAKKLWGKSWMIPQCIWYALARGHGVVTSWGLFECIAGLPAGETSEENRERKILGVPKKNDRGVPGGCTARTLEM